jgi:hypothetical protein
MLQQATGGALSENWVGRLTRFGETADLQSTPGVAARYNRVMVLRWSEMQKKVAALFCGRGRALCTIEIIFSCNHVRNLGFDQADDTPVFEDNTACIEWSHQLICR